MKLRTLHPGLSILIALAVLSGILLVTGLATWSAALGR
jgi:hypothetical protein